MKRHSITTALIVVAVILLASATYGCTSTVNETQKSAEPSAGPSTSVSTTSPSATPAGKSQVDITAQYQGIYTSTNQFDPTPKPGYQFVSFRVTATNINDPNVDLGNVFYFTLFDNNNQGYGPSGLTFSSPEGLKDLPNSHPGDKTSGIVIFEIKQGTTPKQLIYSDFSNKVTITV